MIQWEYRITLHQLPEMSCDGKPAIQCDQSGQCLVHDACRSGLEWLQNVFQELGTAGWELVQSGYHQGELLCIWKKKKD